MADDWTRYALCVGLNPDLFFPDRGDSVVEAKAVCRQCPVQAACLEVGLGERYGIWGGMSERERRLLRRNRGLRDATLLRISRKQAS